MKNAAKNEDKEIWRETVGDVYSSSIHVTKFGGIGINCGGNVIVMSIRDWHEAASNHQKIKEIMKGRTP